MEPGDHYAHPIVHVRTLPPQTAVESFTPVHYKLDQGPMEVSYGFESTTVQYFLSVADTRLRWQDSGPKEVNQVCRALCPGGDGAYLSLYTGPNGAGRRVTVEAMAEFWERYGVPGEHVNAMRQGNKKF